MWPQERIKPLEIIKSTHHVDASCYTLSLDDVAEESFWAAYPNPVYDNLHINPLREAITIMGYRVVDTTHLGIG